MVNCQYIVDECVQRMSQSGLTSEEAVKSCLAKYAWILIKENTISQLIDEVDLTLRLELEYNHSFFVV